MSATLTATTAPKADKPSKRDEVRMLEPLSLVPGWLLWTVIIWENWINLNLDAVYTEKFLSAPLIIAAAKMLVLGMSALVLGLVKPLRYPGGVLLRDLMTFWFISALTWSAWIFLYNLTSPYQMVPGAPDLNARPDEIMLLLDSAGGFRFAVLTAIWLAVGLVVVCGLHWLLKKRGIVAGSVLGNRSNTGMSREPYLQYLTAAILYVALNGLFAWFIRQ